MSVVTGWLALFSWLDVVDMVVVAVFLWLGIRFVRRTRGRTALAGLLLLGGVYVVARAFDLRLVAALFQGFFAALVLIVIVVFQTELRRGFEQLGSWRRRGAHAHPSGDASRDVLLRIVARLASSHTGALFVLPGREPLESHVEGGIELEGRLSEPLLLSLFDSSSPGHDGAVVLRGERVERFAVHLPLSANHAALGPGGTRHAAALGLAERCDATCVVVSEERGTVSVARDGALRTLSRVEDLASLLDAPTHAPGGERPWWRGRTVVDAVLASAGALVLWVALVPGSVPSEVTLEAEVRVSNLPRDLELESKDPETVEVTLRGLRRDLVLSDPGEVRVRVDAYLARLGRRTFTLDEDSVRHPDALEVVNIEPDRVLLSLRPAGDAEATPPDGS